MKRYLMGIDPGLSGGWCAIDLESSDFEYGVMPLAGREINVNKISSIIQMSYVVYIERVHSMPKQGVASTFKFGMGFGQLVGACQALGTAYHLIAPQTWKKVVLQDTKKDKDAAIEYATRRFPEIKLVPPGCRKAHSGIADAVCILHWGVMNHEKENKVKRDIY